MVIIIIIVIITNIIIIIIIANLCVGKALLAPHLVQALVLVVETQLDQFPPFG